MKDIQKVHVGEDYTTYCYTDEEGVKQEVEVTGIAQQLIDTLGEALLKDSFIKRAN